MLRSIKGNQAALFPTADDEMAATGPSVDGVKEEARPFANRILTGDCVDVLSTIPERSVDLVFADPPYNLQLENQLLRPNQTVVCHCSADIHLAPQLGRVARSLTAPR